MPRLKAARGRPPVDGEMSGRETGQAREEVAKCRGSDAEPTVAAVAALGTDVEGLNESGLVKNITKTLQMLYFNL